MWDSMGRPIHPLGIKGWDGQLGHRLKCGTPWDVPYCPIHPLGTKGWDGQLGHRAEVWDSMGHPLLSHTSLRD